MTEEEILITYSLSYSGIPDKTVVDVFKGKRLEIAYYNKYRGGKIYTHSVEQFHKVNDVMEKSFKVTENTSRNETSGTLKHVNNSKSIIQIIKK